MAREAIKDWQGRILGWIEWSGNRKWISNFSGKKLGYYDRSIDMTCDFFGKQIAKGDCVMMLLK